jgi:hypothetical protein
MKQFFWPELARGETLAMAVDIGTPDSLFFLPQRAVPERSFGSEACLRQLPD